MSCGWFFHFFSSWHAACSWFRTCQGSRKPQRNKSGACCDQKQLWHLTASSAQWHHVNKTSSGVSTASLLAVVSGVGLLGVGWWGGLGVRCWGLDWGIKGFWVKRVTTLDYIQMRGYGRGISWGHWGPGYQGPSFLWWRKDPTIIKTFCGAQIQKKQQPKNLFI